MTALAYDLLINQGETWSIIFPVVDVANKPVTVTGWTAKAQIRGSETASVLYEWSATFGNIVVGTTTVTLSVPAATSAAWWWTSGLYDLDLTDTAGRIYRIAQGAVRVSPQITR